MLGFRVNLRGSGFKVAIRLSLITTAFATTTATTATAARLTGFTFGRGDIGLLVQGSGGLRNGFSGLQFGLDGFGCRCGFRLTTATFRALGAFCARRVGIGRRGVRAFALLLLAGFALFAFAHFMA
jgi:hypothetical protein